MSRLEAVAHRVLSPFILGQPGVVPLDDMGSIAAWVQKTALVAMLVSDDAARRDGYGLPVDEYRNLYAVHRTMKPLPDSSYWFGRCNVGSIASVQVTPMVATLPGQPVPERPHGYAMTVVIGQLVLHGVRFTDPLVGIAVAPRDRLAKLWPSSAGVTWPHGVVIDDTMLLSLRGGQRFASKERDVIFEPWRPATELARGRLVSGMIELPTACGKHVVYYPGVLATNARRGRYSAFITSCECPHTYLIVTESNGAHCRAIGTATGISERYEALLGDEIELSDQNGTFVYKTVDAPRAP